MTDIPIQKCGRLLRFRCPKQWEELTPTKVPTLRFCSVCQKNVYFCETLEDLKKNAGRCVAFFVDEMEQERQDQKLDRKDQRKLDKLSPPHYIGQLTQEDVRKIAEEQEPIYEEMRQIQQSIDLRKEKLAERRSKIKVL